MEAALMEKVLVKILSEDVSGDGENFKENGTDYFANRSCRYFPCHESAKGDMNFNCLFCYCPMYRFEKCLGKPAYLELDSGKVIKDCSGCKFPHQPENYDRIMEFLQKNYF